MTSLARHLHGFILDVGLTEDEFRAATALLNELGQFSSDTHNEPVLMAGSLGVSSLVRLLSNGGSILRSDTPGQPMFVAVRIVDPAGVPVTGAEVDVRHSSTVGLYENQDTDQADFNLRARSPPTRMAGSGSGRCSRRGIPFTPISWLAGS